MLMKPSDEQSAVIDALSSNYNVVVDSVAGSGKTTTNLFIAQSTIKRILLLTYNKSLKFETRARVEAAGLTNIDVHSYHSFCVTNYDSACHRDIGIKNMLAGDGAIATAHPYDIIVFDEAQDITPLLFRLALKVISDTFGPINGANPQIVIMGDFYQSIYDFNGADGRYISLADEIFPQTREWRRLNLSVSYRLTAELAAFVNHAIGTPRMRTVKSGPKPHYNVINPWNNKGALFDTTIGAMLALGYTPAQIFIMAPSVKSGKSPVRMLANEATSRGIHIYVPKTDDEEIRNEILINKIVFSSFHQAKGLERPAVIVFGFDAGYYEFYNKSANPRICTNQLYVAITRSSKHMVLCQSRSKPPLAFLRPEIVREICTGEMSMRGGVSAQNEVKISVSALADKITLDQELKLKSMLTITTLRKPAEPIIIPGEIKCVSNYRGREIVTTEQIYDATGVAVPQYFQFAETGKLAILNKNGRVSGGKLVDIRGDSIGDFDGADEYLRVLDRSPADVATSVPRLLIAANMWNAYIDCLSFKLFQVNNYTWLNGETLEKCVARLRSVATPSYDGVATNAEFEHRASRSYTYGTPYLIMGAFDYINDFATYEFKCVQAIESRHIFQLAIYAWLRKTPHLNYLYNAIDDNLLEISGDFDSFMAQLMEYKFAPKKRISDDEFRRQCAIGDAPEADAPNVAEFEYQ